MLDEMPPLPEDPEELRGRCHVNGGEREGWLDRGPSKEQGIGKTYVSRLLSLTLLAPEIVEAILDGRQPARLQLDDRLNRFPLEWVGQVGPTG